jgi:hypothetical protein
MAEPPAIVIDDYDTQLVCELICFSFYLIVSPDSDFRLMRTILLPMIGTRRPGVIMTTPVLSLHLPSRLQVQCRPRVPHLNRTCQSSRRDHRP